MTPNRWTRQRSRRVAAVAIAAAVLLACGGDGDGGASDGGGDGDTAGGAGATTLVAVPPTDAAPTTTGVPSTVAATAAPTTLAPATVANENVAMADAEIIATIELGRADLGFLISDGEALWATGDDGAVVRIDPDTGEVAELMVGDGLISGQLLPAVVDESVWFSAIQGSHIVRLDRTTLAADPPIEVPGTPGVVLRGPDDQLWVSYLYPAELRTIDETSDTVGEAVPVESEGEMIGATSAFGALWVTLYDDGELVKLDGAGAELERRPTGVGPAYVREVAGWLWHANSLDGTIARVDAATLDVTIADLNAGGPTIDQPSAVVGTDGAIWARAARLTDGAAIVFRIGPDTGLVEGRRTLPGGRRLQQIAGMATVGDRLFVLDRPGRVLLELDTDQFLVDDLPPPTSVAEDPETADVTEAVRSLLAAATTPEQMADGIVDGDRLADQIAAFKQFFVDNLPGEEYEGDTISVRIDGDVAEIEFFIVVAGQPIGDPVSGTVVRKEERWMLSADSFCRLIATGGIECPADLGASG